MIWKNYYIFEFVLNDHDRDVYNHYGECNEVYLSNDSDHKVLMSNGWYQECGQEAYRFVNLPSTERIVDMSHQEAMNWKIPLSPILWEVSRVPPVMVESTISKLCQLTPEIHIRMEEAIEPHKP